VRSNLDPFHQYTDIELQEALQRVHLVQPFQCLDDNITTETEQGNVNINIFEKLSSTISEGGLNLSQGQRQLLCLARAVVSRPKMMILDEATSAVDMATDALIQRSIREEFSDSTLIVIAHRLSTVAGFGGVLVLNEGRAEEFGSPRELLKKRGIFQSMVENSGEKEQLEGMILGGTGDGSILNESERVKASCKGKAREET
jgi:ABC-type multidrug transport system fused ATPase/permease subunit